MPISCRSSAALFLYCRSKTHEMRVHKWMMIGLLLLSLLSDQATLTIISDKSICKISSDQRLADCRGRLLAEVPVKDLPPSLEEVDLSHNALQVIHHDAFSHLYRLRVLQLQYNNISLIEDDAFRFNPLLEYLDVFNNSLRAIPTEALKPASRLRILRMSNNFYTEATLDNIFASFTHLKELSFGGPFIQSLKKGDFQALQKIPLDTFAIKTASSLQNYEPGCLKVIQTKNMWFDVALDQKPDILPVMLGDLANKTFAVLRFRNLFEFKYYSGEMNIFQGLADIKTHQLIFYRGKFNEHLLRMALINIQVSPIRGLGLLFIDFARSPTFVDSGVGSSVTALALDDLVLWDISNPDILRFDWRFTWFSKVRRLSIKNVNFNFVPCDAWDEMGMIEVLDVSNNRLQDHYLYNRRCQYSGAMTSLHSFNCSTNELSSLSDIASLTTEFWKLKVLDLSYNQLGSKEGACTWKSNITRMILHHNNFVSSTLSCLPTTVQYLDLSFCNLDLVDMDYFKQATNLKELLLSGNKIKFIPSGWSNPALLSLALDGNSFGLISMSSFKNMPSLSRLKAGNNPYHCTCDLHAFIQETTAKGKVNITDWPDNYRCYHPEAWLNTVVANFFPGRIACDIRLVIVISVVTTTVVVLAVMVLCYVFNVPWYAKATYQILRAKYRAHKEGEGVLQTYAYHAFISYSHSDADWVRDKLLPCLENSEPPYNLCIHERDFLPGKWIIDNIIENMENSRKVIFVLSRNFVNSEWCNYELYFANQRAIGKTFNDVILVVKEPIEPNSLPNKYCKLKKMLSTKTYLEWPHEAKHQVFFWAQLKSVLGKPSIPRDRASSTRSPHSEVNVSVVELPLEEGIPAEIIPVADRGGEALPEVLVIHKTNIMVSKLENAMESLIRVFHNYSSKEGDKYKLSKVELKSLLQGELCDFLTASKDPMVVEKIMTDLDENRDGEVDFQEFVVLVAALTVACNEFFVESMKQ
ncbi:toll-like receptor 18 [Anguilla anguilla]|uniref:toll-like receptor 18 n=1 Tax=Anguilla anguilla TaxID=7936 RepID=UPI0015A9D719|nr:toll-like receptor 18 [Anguilla anguilla]